MSFNHTVEPALGTTASPITLTAAYSGNVSSAIKMDGADAVSLDVGYTMGTAETANSIQLKVEYADPTNGAPASTDWMQEGNEATSGATTTVTLGERTFTATVAAATYDYFTVSLPLAAKHKYIRVSAKETGIAANGGSAVIRVILAENNNGIN